MSGLDPRGVLAQMRTRLRALFDRSTVEEELDDELRFHLEMEIEENVRRGLDRRAAERQARLDLGGIEGLKEAHRDQRGIRWLDDFARDARWAWRRFARRPGATLAALLTLGLGVGATTAVYGVLQGVFLQPLPYGAGERIVQIRQPLDGQGIEDLGISVPELEDLRARTSSFDAIVEYHSLWFNLFDHGEPERVLTGVVTAGFFRELGVEAADGRLFLPEDERHGADPVLVLSHDYFRERFGGDPDVVGREVEMNERIHTIVGVLPPLPRFPRADDVYMPTTACPFRSGEGWTENRSFRALAVFGVLRPGVAREDAERELESLAGTWRAEYPELYPGNAGHGLRAPSLVARLTAGARPVLATLFATVALVWLLACANVANLGLAQGLRRVDELRMQIALGASRGRIARQLLAESALLGLGAGVVGWLLAWATHGTLVRFVERLTPRARELELDLHLALSALAFAIVAALLAGGIPALGLLGRDELTGPSGVGRTTDDRHRSRLRDALVAVQVALAVVLLAGAALLGRSFWELTRVGPGFDTRDVLTLQLDLDFRKYMEQERRTPLFEAILTDVRDLPGVDSAALVGTLPLDGGLMQGPARLDGDPRPETELPRVALRAATPGWFRTLRIPLLRGRVFDTRDDAEGQRVGILSRAAVARLFGSDDSGVLGRQISVGGSQPVTIVGVVEDVHQEGLDAEPLAEIYFPLAMAPPLGASLAVRSPRPTASLLEDLEAVVHRHEPRQPIAAVSTLEGLRQNHLTPYRVMSTLLGTLAGLAFLITAVGIGAVVAFTVGRRTREIGIRRALGARDREVVSMLVREAMAPVAVGVVVGLGVARLVAPSLDRLLFRVGAGDPLVHLGVAVLLLAVALVASGLPARRATGIDPVRALRTE